MDNIKRQSYDIECLQKNLNAIRKIAGWTTEQLGEKIGVTKQTISNLENLKTPMTLTQYIAIRTIIDYEIRTNTENQVLTQVIDILLNNNEYYNDEKQNKVEDTVKAISGVASSGIDVASLVAISTGLISAVLGASYLLPKTKNNTDWVSKLFKK